MLTATAASRSSIDLSWTVPDDKGTPITGYDIQRWDNTGDAWATGTNLLMDRTTVSVTEYTDSNGTVGLTPGTKYYYRIRALTGEGDEGAWSAEENRDGAASATTHGGAPGAIGTDDVDFTVTAVGGMNTDRLPGGINLGWNAPDDTGGSSITGYDVQIWDGSNQRWVDEATTTTTSYEDRGLARGATYYYRVRAKNSQGDGPWTDYELGMTPVAAPDAPVLTAMALGTDSIRLTWTTPAANGMDITDYNLQKWDSDTNAWFGTDLVGEAAVNLHVDTNVTAANAMSVGVLKPGTSYIYQVLAVNGAGSSAWSTLASATSVAAAPGRPLMFTAAPDGENAIDLSWLAPASDGGNAIIRYELERWNSGTSSWVTVTSAVPSNRTSYKVTGLTEGTRYIYRLRAINRAPTNNGIGLWSTMASASTDAADE